MGYPYPPWENWYKLNFVSLCTHHPSDLWTGLSLSMPQNISVALPLSSSDNQQVFHLRTSMAIVFISLTKRFPIYLPWGGTHVAVLILSRWTDCTPEPHLRTHRSTPFSLSWCPRSLSSVSAIYCFLQELLRLSFLPMFSFLLHLIWFQTKLA